jgi:hypothetical protein
VTSITERLFESGRISEMKGIRPSREVQREHARDLICAWAMATERLLSVCDPDAVEAMFATARAHAEARAAATHDRRRRERDALLTGRLAADVFTERFVRRCRRAASA